MAIVEFGTIITAARGTIGGLTLSANKSGPYAKLWAKGANQRSILQTAQRNVIATHAQAWRGITAGQRTAWDTYAALAAQDLTNPLGETYSISGFLWFVRINSNRAQAGQTQLNAAPTIAIPGAPTITAAYLKTDAASTESRLEIASTDSTHEDTHVVTARIYNSVGRISGAFNLANILTAAPANPPATKLTLTGTADSEPLGAATNATDGNLATIWGAVTSLLPHWWQGNIATSDRAPNSYRFNSGSGASSEDAAPRDWTFEYWDGAAWQIADTVVDYTVAHETWESFTVDDPDVADSDRWRINITDNNGSAAVGFAEFEIYGFDVTDNKFLNFQTEIQARLGTVLLGQKVFYECRVQTSEGRRGPASSTTALAAAT